VVVTAILGVISWNW